MTSSLHRRVQFFADLIEDPPVIQDAHEPRTMDGYDFLYQHSHAVEYIIDGDGNYLGGRVLVNDDPITIWIDTRDNEIRGTFGLDRYTYQFDDVIGLDEALNELWAKH